MTKKIGLGLLIVSFIAVTLPLFYLPTSIFTFILYSFAVLIIFGIAVGLIFVDQPFKASWVPIILLNLIFTVANSMVGVMIDGKVTELAGVKKFAVAGFQYQPALSTPTKLVFVKA